MNFHLNYTPPTSVNKLSYSDNIMLIGSCFSESIGASLKKNKFKINVNPSGVVFNPESICKTLTYIIKGGKFQKHDLFQFHDLWYHWDFHSRFSNIASDICLDNINTSVKNAHIHLKNSKWLFITLGSSHVYKLSQTNVTVANCHKLPQEKFEKNLLPALEIEQQLIKLVKDLKVFNPSLQIVFTVSPVRYLKDGLIENNISKAQLFSAIHKVTSKYDNCHYFPAYELIIDDLRDYRFFKDDLTHPNEQAIRYVFDKFLSAYLDDEGRKLLGIIEQIQSAMDHKPFNPESSAHQKFKQAQLNICNSISKQYPYLNLSKEISFFKS